MMSKEQEKESKAISKLVNMKLDLYINQEKRENRFDPCGKQRTTRRMEGYDLAYRVLELTSLSKNKKGNNKQHQQKEKDGSDKQIKAVIKPKLAHTSLRTTQLSEANRITEYANQVWNSCPTEQLSVIHRYRPHSSNVIKSVENGHVQNYSRHVGAALQQNSYVNYYNNQGLNSANPKKSKRMENLSPRKPEQEETKNKNDSRTGQSKEKHNNKKRNCEKQEQNEAFSQRNYRSSSKTTTGNQNKRKSNFDPIKIEFKSDTQNSTRSDAEYSDDFDEPHRPTSQADDKHQTKGNEETTSLASSKGKEENTGVYEDDFEHDTLNDLCKKSSDTSDNKSDTYAVSSDEGVQTGNKSEKDEKSNKNVDTASLQTYTSVEYAYEKQKSS